MISIPLTISILLATSALTAGYALATGWLPAAGMLILGALWMLGQRARWSWIAWLLMMLFTIAAAAGTWFGVNPVLLVAGLIAALSAWDLDHFKRQLKSAGSVEPKDTLKRHHLQRLLLVDGLGLLSTVLALEIRIELSFALALVLGLIALVGLSRAISFLRRESG